VGTLAENFPVLDGLSCSSWLHPHSNFFSNSAEQYTENCTLILHSSTGSTEERLHLHPNSTTQFPHCWEWGLTPNLEEHFAGDGTVPAKDTDSSCGYKAEG